MSSLHKNYISCGILLIGFLFFSWYVNTFEFIAGSITLLVSLLLWVAFNVHFDMFNKVVFSKILCGAGLITSISILFLFGIEEVPFPEGALLFHGYGIALALLGTLLSVIPILFISDIQSLDNSPNSQSSQISAFSSNNNSLDDIDDDWEIASEEDVHSDKFEVAA
tara:strand:- start:262 stop:759 length:498 start_codon:yes stop_codon:yes gene_type:complete